MKQQLTWKICLKKVIAAGPILFILILTSWIVVVSIIRPESFKASGHGNALPYLFMGSILTTVLLSLINLTYLLPTDNLKLRFLAPGMTTTVLFSIGLFDGDPIATPLFIGAGLINLLIGFYHYKKILKHNKLE